MMSKLTDKDETRAEESQRQDESATEMELPATDSESAVALLQSWCDEEDSQEQRETWTFLKTALDEDRLSDRKLFP